MADPRFRIDGQLSSTTIDIVIDAILDCIECHRCGQIVLNSEHFVLFRDGESIVYCDRCGSEIPTAEAAVRP